MSSSLAELHAAGVLEDVDVAFAGAMARLSGEDDARVLVAAALASRAVRDGDVCLDLPALCSDGLAVEVKEGAPAPSFEALQPWLSVLAKSPLCGRADGDTPLVLAAAGRLYLRRYYERERHVASTLIARASSAPPACDERVLTEGLERLFPPSAAGLPDDQRRAAEQAVRGRLCVISGGPGTGKTRTVARILALLADQARACGRAPPRVELLAPTGKAAARLTESMRGARADAAVAAALGELGGEARTLHRALGLGRRGGPGRANAERPLGAEVVVVDEASMVDVELMSRVLEALLPDARLVLLGDRNQLASVEAGAVLGDICGRELASGARGQRPELARAIVTLERSYRYGSDTAIGRLAQAIVRGDADAALAVLRDPAQSSVRLMPHAAGRDPLSGVRASAHAAFAPLHAAAAPVDKLGALERVRVLCALRRGPFGQLALNAALEAEVLGRAGTSRATLTYAGRPLLVTQNDSGVRLWNGDVGVLAPEEPGSERVVAWFPGEGSALRDVSLARLPPHESAYAMSVHKSQGSELDEVLLLLPPEPSPVLSRELLYTAVTRARERVTIFGSPEIVRHAIEHPVRRASGLSELLWGPEPSPA